MKIVLLSGGTLGLPSPAQLYPVRVSWLEWLDVVAVPLVDQPVRWQGGSDGGLVRLNWRRAKPSARRPRSRTAARTPR